MKMLFYTCLITQFLIQANFASYSDKEDYFNHGHHGAFELPEFIVNPDMITTRVETTTILPWLTTTTTKTTTTTTTPFGFDPRKTTKFFVVHDSNSSDIYTIDDTTTPSTTIPPFLTGQVSLSPTPFDLLTAKPKQTTSSEYPNIIPPPLSNFTATTEENLGYGAGLTATESTRTTETEYYIPTNATQSTLPEDLATIDAIARSLGSSFVDLTNKKRMAAIRLPLMNESPSLTETSQEPETVKTTVRPIFKATPAINSTNTTEDITQQNIQQNTTETTTEHQNVTAETEAMKPNLKDIFSEDQAETIPFKFSLATTILNKEDVIEYEDLTTEPFSKYLELFLLRLAKLNDTLTARMLTRFSTRMKNLVADGRLMAYGPTTMRYIEHCTRAVEVPNDVLKRMVIMGHNAMVHRRKVISSDLNSLLDFVDMIFTAEEETDMEAILNDTMKYPDGEKEHREIVEDFIQKVILHPTRRVSGTVNGRILFDSISKIVHSWRQDNPMGWGRRGIDGGNLELETNLKRYKEINDNYIKDHINGRVKIKISKNETDDKISIERRYDFDDPGRANKKKQKRSSEPRFGTSMRSFNDKHRKKPIYNDISKFKFSKGKNDISRETKSPMKNFKHYLKSLYGYENIEGQYKPHMNDKRFDSNMMRQRVNFMGNNTEFNPFNIKTKSLKNNRQAFNYGYMNIQSRQKNQNKRFGSTQMMADVAPVTSVSIPKLYMNLVESTTLHDEVSKVIQKIGNGIEVHKYVYTKSPMNYIRVQPTTDKKPDNTEYISFEINNLSNIVNIGMKLKFKKAVSLPTEPTVRASVMYKTTDPTVSIASNKPAVNTVTKNDLRTWNYNMHKYIKRNKDITNESKLLMLRTKPTASVDKDLSLFDLYDAYTLKKGLEIPLLGDTTVNTLLNKVASEKQLKEKELYRKYQLRHHKKKKRDKHKHQWLKYKKHESRKNRHTHKRKEYMKKHNKEHRKRKRRRHHKKKFNIRGKFNRRNDVDLWDYYLKRAKETDQSEDVENSFDSTHDISGLNSSPVNKEKEIIRNNGHVTEPQADKENYISSDYDDSKSNSGMEIIWYEKNDTDKQLYKLRDSKSSIENKSNKLTKNKTRINEYDEFIQTFNKHLQYIKMTNHIKPSVHKYKKEGARSQQKKGKNTVTTKKQSKKLKKQVVNEILNNVLSADIDGIKSQVINDIKRQKEVYYNRIETLTKQPKLLTKTSKKVKHPKVHKNLISIRGKDDLRRQNTQMDKKPKLPKFLLDSEYSDDEAELKKNLNDALRHGDGRDFRRNLENDFLSKKGLRDDSEYTDTEAVLKQNVYKAIQKT